MVVRRESTSLVFRFNGEFAADAVSHAVPLGGAGGAGLAGGWSGCRRRVAAITTPGGSSLAALFSPERILVVLPALRSGCCRVAAQRRGDALDGSTPAGAGGGEGDAIEAGWCRW